MNPKLSFPHHGFYTHPLGTDVRKVESIDEVSFWTIATECNAVNLKESWAFVFPVGKSANLNLVLDQRSRFGGGSAFECVASFRSSEHTVNSRSTDSKKLFSHVLCECKF